MSDQFSIRECERKAKDANASDSATFDLVGPGGRLPCRWLDAYFGMFIVGDSEGFTMVKSVPENFWCENFKTGEQA